jgi:hypothetical protein
MKCSVIALAAVFLSPRTDACRPMQQAAVLFDSYRYQVVKAAESGGSESSREWGTPLDKSISIGNHEHNIMESSQFS